MEYLHKLLGILYGRFVCSSPLIIYSVIYLFQFILHWYLFNPLDYNPKICISLYFCSNCSDFQIVLVLAIGSGPCVPLTYPITLCLCVCVCNTSLFSGTTESFWLSNSSCSIFSPKCLLILFSFWINSFLKLNYSWLFKKNCIWQSSFNFKIVRITMLWNGDIHTLGNWIVIFFIEV